MIYKGERVLPGQRHEPERHLREVDRYRVPVHAVQTSLRDEAAGEDHLVLVWRNQGLLSMSAPRLDQGVAELTAGFDQKGPGAHRRVADLEVEDLLWRRWRVL